ncbi:unnamed protein product [Meganyctiphanes norvegica]|uniref:Major facilitator superfamily (MFS) profile domain-containing protein n=1 Tax=Meganyctiphanes norvegica TaxID=48144 RepID=A0AAV2S603_MEGNR
MDEALTLIGLGWFQVTPIVTTLLIQGSYATQHVATVFTDMPRNFKCNTEPGVEDNSTSFNNLCSIRNQTDNSIIHSKEHLCTEFMYDKTLFESTFSSEFNLVCEKSWLSGMFKTSGFIGVIFGCIYTGLGDRWGRVSVVRVITFLYLLSVLVVGLVPEMYSIIIARFVVGFCYEILNGTSYTLMMEVLPLKYRSTIGAIVSNIAYTFFAILTGTVSYFIRSWRTLHLILSIPIFLQTVCIFFLCKSPRWLVNVGNFEEAIKVLIKGSKQNHVDLSSEALNSIRASIQPSIKESDEQVPNKKCQVIYSFSSLLKVLFSTPKMRKISVIFPALWFLTGIVYFSIPLNANNFSSNNPFQYIVVMALADIPPNIFIPILIKYLGNVKTISFMFILTMACLVIVVFIPEHLTWVKWTFTIAAMVTISCCFMIAYILGSELFPTPVRSVGFGMGSIARHTGILTIQYVIDTAFTLRMWWLPNVVAAVCCLLAFAVSVGMLPETHGQPLCDTVEQVENRSKTNQIKNDIGTHL